MIPVTIESRITEITTKAMSTGTLWAHFTHPLQPRQHCGKVQSAFSVVFAGLCAVLLSGCTTYRICPHLSDVPPGTPAAIDGQYSNYRLEKGRGYATKNYKSGLRRNRVTIMDLKKTGPGRYSGQAESYNPQKRLSAFGPVTIDIVEPYKIRVTYGANPSVGITEESWKTWTASTLDDKQGFLRELVQKPDVTLSARIHAATQITDRELLESLTLPSVDPAIRIAAEVRLGRRTWQNVIKEAEHDPSKVGPTLAAIAWADNQSALRERVTSLCHSYIRRGDVRYVPDLVKLLHRYGSKLLAEDYMNCGQSDLDEAGRKWAWDHDYRVCSGPGSHRVRWGEGR